MGSIKKELLSGVFYTAIAKYSGILISLIFTTFAVRKFIRMNSSKLHMY